MKRLSLRKRLMFTVGAVSSLGLLLVMVLAAKMSDVIHFGKESSVKLAAESVAKNVDKSLQERIQESVIFSASDAVLGGDPARLVPYLNELIGDYNGIYSAMVVTNRHGKAIAVNTVDENMKGLRADRVLGKDFSQARWFQKAVTCSSSVKGACVFVEEARDDDDVIRSLGRNGNVLGFSVPIHNNRNGDIVGVLTSRASWEGTVAATVGEQVKLLQGGWLPKVLISIQDKQGKFLIESPKVAGSVYEARADLLTPGIARASGWTAVVQVPINDSVRSFNLWIQIASVALAVLAFFASWWVIRGTIRPFNSAFRELDTQSDDLRNASAQLTNASQDLAQAATEQSSSLQETASSIDEINSMINRSAENAERSIRIAGSSQDAATRGKKVVDDMIHAISDISDSNNNILKQIEASNQQLTEIIKVISEIGNKTKVINDIAFQTKLLSFNASVEAARAGEHGKGFAVVAEEVGSLAQMSGNAAKDIGEMLNGSIQTVQSIVETSRGRVEKLIAEGKSKIDSGIQVARQCESVLEEIVRAEAQMNSIINEIANASREQAQGMGEITKAVGQLDQVTNRNATIAQQTEGFAEAIARLAKSLREHVHAFRGLIEGGGTGSRSKSRPSAKTSANAVAESGVKNFSQELHDLFTSAEPPGNVIPFRPIDGQAQSGGNEGAGAAIRGVDEVPSESDPRFKEV